MSSNEEEYDPNIVSKKRRIQRACDICRRKKIRCNGVQMPGNRCSNCITYNYECSYVETAKKRGPSKGYVESLENRVQKLEKLLKRLCPDESLLRELDIAIEKEDFDLNQPPLDPSPLFESSSSISKPPSQSNLYSPDPSSTIATTTSGATDTPNTPNDDAQSARSFVDFIASTLRRYGSAYFQPPPDDDAQVILSDHFKQLSVEQPKDYRFFGKSSGAMLIQTALELKNEYTGKGTWSMKPEDLSWKRDRFWTKPPWEEQTLTALTSTRPPYSFPEPDLLRSLVDLYFHHVNTLMPLLHRPTFERGINEGLHLQDPKFGANVLLVCANGARFSDDPRVLSETEREQNENEEGQQQEGEEDSAGEGEGKGKEGESQGQGQGQGQTGRRTRRRLIRHSSGWKWFEQVQMVRRTFLTPANVYDLQFYSLSVLFLQGSSAPQACWAMVGVGIRLAQDVGAHRKRKTKGPMTVEDELWKRAFWVLVSIDRGVSSALGRPTAIHDEDFDIDLPVDCDDEYWEHPDPEKRWKQPPGKPSLVASFLCFLKLSQVLAFALRTIYAINKSKILLGLVENEWEQLIVAELDSALNRFVDSVPDHLRWDPNREDQKFFVQSVLIWTSYYHIQILIHRPFIPSPSKPSPLSSLPSLTICTNAARSCIRVVEVLHKKFSLVYPPVQMAVFTSSIVLLLSIWAGKRNGLMADPTKEMKDVHKSMTILKSSETLYHSSGRLWDLLYELASVGDLPLPPQRSPWNSNKRERNSDSPISSNVSETANTPPLGPRTVVGSKRVSSANRRQQHQQQQQPQQHHVTTPTTMFRSAMTQQQPQPGMVNLPLYSNELGRIPSSGDSEFAAQGLLPSSSHSHSRLPHHHPHPHPHPHPHHHQQPQQQQALDPNYWYPFEQSQMRELQGMGNILGPETPLVPSAGPSPSIGSSSTIGGGLSSSTGVETNTSGIPSSSTSEADFIFGQLAMGYPMAYATDLQTATLSQMLEMGMLSGGGAVGGVAEPGGQQGMQRYGTTGVGRGAVGGGEDTMGGGNGTASPYLDNDTMNMPWTSPSAGFQ